MDVFSSNLNWWAIVLAVLSTLPVGYVWYDLKIGFGKPWMKLNGLKTSQMESSEGMVKTFAMMLLVSLATAVVMAGTMRSLGISGVAESLFFGSVFGLVLRGGAHFIHNGFARKPDELTLIDVGHDFVSLTVMALILGLWV